MPGGVMTALRTLGFAAGLRLTRLSLRTIGFRRTVTLLGRLPSLPHRGPKGGGDAARWADMIHRVNGRPYGGTCLDRSVFLWFLMRRNSIEGRLRIGVAYVNSRLDGHAWVELDGHVVNDDPDVADRFTVFDEDPTGLVFS
jgi:hypothetical protein